MPKTDDDSIASHSVPYTIKVERIALGILKDNPDDEKKIKELLEEYAAKYAEENTSGT